MKFNAIENAKREVPQAVRLEAMKERDESSRTVFSSNMTHRRNVRCHTLTTINRAETNHARLDVVFDDGTDDVAFLTHEEIAATRNFDMQTWIDQTLDKLCEAKEKSDADDSSRILRHDRPQDGREEGQL